MPRHVTAARPFPATSDVVPRSGPLAPLRRWDEDAAAHLLRRAGFGGPPSEVEELHALGLDGAVDRLVDYERLSQVTPAFEPVEGGERSKVRNHIRGLAAEKREELFDNLRRLDRIQAEDLRAWWITRMIRTKRPLEEKLTFFWHGHFTSGHREVRNSTWMWRQNDLYRKHAAGNFGELVLAVSRDPAMLRYLDNASNRKSAPNENYARELLELFTLGEGHYTEADIKAAARAFTGWTLRDGEFFFRRNQHDDDEKTFLSQSGGFDGADIVRIILDQPQCARYLAGRLWKFFVEEEGESKTVEALADLIRAQKYELRPVLETLFRSQAFYDAKTRFAMVKSPIELVVGTVRSLEPTQFDAFALAAAARRMGQELFQPPTVKGWDGGRRWINTATLFTRYNFATDLLAGTKGGSGDMGPAAFRRRREAEGKRQEIIDALKDIPGLETPPLQARLVEAPSLDPAPMIQANGLSDAARVFNHCMARLLRYPLDPLQKKQLRQLLDGDGADMEPMHPEGRRRTLSLVNAILCMPEYQVQ